MSFKIVWERRMWIQGLLWLTKRYSWKSWACYFTRRRTPYPWISPDCLFLGVWSCLDVLTVWLCLSSERYCGADWTFRLAYNRQGSRFVSMSTWKMKEGKGRPSRFLLENPISYIDHHEETVLGPGWLVEMQHLVPVAQKLKIKPWPSFPSQRLRQLHLLVYQKKKFLGSKQALGETL